MNTRNSWVFLDTFPTYPAAFSPVPRISPASVCPNKRNKRILYGSTDYDPNKLQRLQNTAARLIKGAKKNDHIMPVLEELHWLPIRYRIQFKILLLVYKCHHGLAPQFPIELIKLRCRPSTLRSSHRLVLEKPIINMVSYGQRAFSYAGPELWNTLPEHIKNSKSVNDFKKKFKNLFFSISI